jgi:hypothetical protein
VSSAQVNYQLREMLSIGGANVKDPGDGGLISFQGKGLAVCNVTTSGAASRRVYTPVAEAELVRLVVNYKSGSGTLTVTDDAGSPNTLTELEVGEAAEFIVTEDASGKSWKLVANAIDSADFVSAAATLGAGQIIVGADNKDVEAVDLTLTVTGTGVTLDITGAVTVPADTDTTTDLLATPASGTEEFQAAFLELTAALFAAGLISADFTATAT